MNILVVLKQKPQDFSTLNIHCTMYASLYLLQLLFLTISQERAQQIALPDFPAGLTDTKLEIV